MKYISRIKADSDFLIKAQIFARTRTKRDIIEKKKTRTHLSQSFLFAYRRKLHFQITRLAIIF